MSDVTATPKKTSRTEAADGVKPGFKRVIVRRPYGETDSHKWFGFNDFGAQIQFDEPVELPEDFVNYLRSASRVEYRADEKGQPTPSYSAAYNIVEA